MLQHPRYVTLQIPKAAGVKKPQNMSNKSVGRLKACQTETVSGPEPTIDCKEKRERWMGAGMPGSARGSICGSV